MRQANVSHRPIAFMSIQERRARTTVPCGPGGNLHDYVPFYFAPRSPMLYTIHRGNVAGCEEGQNRIVHLVSTVQAMYAANRPCVFTDGHAIMALSRFFQDPDDLKSIDWKLMQSRAWFDTPEDNDRKRRRPAEFLVHQAVPWDLVLEVGIIDRAVKVRVEQLLAGTAHRPAVRVRSGWYFPPRQLPP
jgi:ssDNA thymidine ADP-ribosyltransferase, DarT